MNVKTVVMHSEPEWVVEIVAAFQARDFDACESDLDENTVQDANPDIAVFDFSFPNRGVGLLTGLNEIEAMTVVVVESKEFETNEMLRHIGADLIVSRSTPIEHLITMIEDHWRTSFRVSQSESELFDEPTRPRIDPI